MTLLAYDVDLAAIEAQHRSRTRVANTSLGGDQAETDGAEGADSEHDPNGLPYNVALLLHPAHRQATAAKVNAAILTSQSHGPQPKLPNLLKMLSWGETLLAEKMDFPRMDILVGNPKENAMKKEQVQQQQTGSGGDVAMM